MSNCNHDPSNRSTRGATGKAYKQLGRCMSDWGGISRRATIESGRSPRRPRRGPALSRRGGGRIAGALPGGLRRVPGRWGVHGPPRSGASRTACTVRSSSSRRRRAGAGRGRRSRTAHQGCERLSRTSVGRALAASGPSPWLEDPAAACSATLLRAGWMGRAGNSRNASQDSLDARSISLGIR